MNRRRRNLLIQISLGLSAGLIVPLAVIGTLLVTGPDSDGTTVRISPTAAATPTPRGIQATRGQDLERYLLTPADLGSGWTVLDSPGHSSGLTMNQAVSGVPEIPGDCSAFEARRAQAFRTPLAGAILVNRKARRSVTESIYAFRPGVAQESLAYLRGLVARCNTYRQTIKLPGATSTSRVTTTVLPGPRLGDESLRLRTRRTYGGRVSGGFDSVEVYVRVGDTVLRCGGTSGDLDALAAKAFEKIS